MLVHIKAVCIKIQLLAEEILNKTAPSEAKKLNNLPTAVNVFHILMIILFYLKKINTASRYCPAARSALTPFLNPRQLRCLPQLFTFH